MLDNKILTTIKLPIAIALLLMIFFLYSLSHTIIVPGYKSFHSFSFLEIYSFFVFILLVIFANYSGWILTKKHNCGLLTSAKAGALILFIPPFAGLVMFLFLLILTTGVFPQISLETMSIVFDYGGYSDIRNMFGIRLVTIAFTLIAAALVGALSGLLGGYFGRREKK